MNKGKEAPTAQQGSPTLEIRNLSARPELSISVEILCIRTDTAVLERCYSEQKHVNLGAG